MRDKQRPAASAQAAGAEPGLRARAGFTPTPSVCGTPPHPPQPHQRGVGCDLKPSPPAGFYSAQAPVPTESPRHQLAADKAPREAAAPQGPRAGGPLYPPGSKPLSSLRGCSSTPTPCPRLGEPQFCSSVYTPPSITRPDLEETGQPGSLGLGTGLRPGPAESTEEGGPSGRRFLARETKPAFPFLAVGK